MNELPITAVDIVILAVLLISAIAAFARGFVHEVLSIGAWVGAGVATLYLFTMAQPYARELVAIPLIADIGAGVAIFLACLILLSILTRLVAGRVKDSALGALDRSLGLVFGLARGAVIVVLAWLVMAWALPEPSERPDYIQAAKSRRLVEAGAGLVARLLPGDVGTQARTATGGGAGAVPAPNGDGDDRTSTGTQGSDVERWSQPKAEAEAPEEKDGYDKDVRKELDSLIESTTN